MKSGRKILLNTPEEEAAINAGIAADPDSFVSDEMMARMRPMPMVGRPRLEQPKKITTIRFDFDVLEALKATGKGWQTRVNEVLRMHFLEPAKRATT